LLSAIFSAGCLDFLPGKPQPKDRYERPEEITEFPILFSKHCSGCHGADGEMGPAPPLNDRMFLAICSDADLKQVITSGRTGTPMPAMSHLRGGPLTDVQIDSVVRGIRANWGAESRQVQPPLPSYRRLSPPDDQGVAGHIKAGKQKFSEYCAACHGPDGRGDTAGALNDVAFLGTISNQALRRIIITGRSDVGMPNYREVGADSSWEAPLTSQDIADLVALLDSWRTADTGIEE
jgi:mono/diheme cytochrome c family protein